MARYGLTFGNPKDNDVKSISDPIVVQGKNFYVVTFTNGDTMNLECDVSKQITSIVKTKSWKLVDTFTVLYDDSTTSEFELLNGKHTYNDYKLLLESYYIPEPSTKMELVDLPFSSGSIDLTEATGTIPYKDREGLEFVFNIRDDGHDKFAMAVQKISMFLHGKSLKMITDFEPNYYYMVRLELNPHKTSRLTGQITLSGTSKPFKYSLLASNEPWEWNPFNFVTGIIQDTSDLNINGTGQITIMAGGVPTCPEFYVSKIDESLSIIYDEKEYLFTNGVGTYRFPQIQVSEDDAVIKFKGKGRVSVIYRGRFL